jgi:hypothetical protein
MSHIRGLTSQAWRLSTKDLQSCKIRRSALVALICKTLTFVPSQIHMKTQLRSKNSEATSKFETISVLKLMPRSEPQYVRILFAARLISTMWIQKSTTIITSGVRLLLRKTKRRTRFLTLYKRELSRRLTPENTAPFMTGGRTRDSKYQRTRREAS